MINLNGEQQEECKQRRRKKKIEERERIVDMKCANGEKKLSRKSIDRKEQVVCLELSWTRNQKEIESHLSD